MDSKGFSKRLELIMERQDLNASSFAEQVGVGRSSISHILSGRNKPSLDFVLSVVDNFKEVDLQWLLYGSGTYSPQKDESKNQDSSPVQEINKEVNSRPASQQDVANPTLFEDTAPSKVDEDSTVKHLKKGKNITKVIWFYTDGTFDEFDPNVVS